MALDICWLGPVVDVDGVEKIKIFCPVGNGKKKKFWEELIA
jgi:hypothetical protein